MTSSGRVRALLASAGQRLRANAWSLLQITIAAIVAYALASLLLDPEDTVFAPIGAVVTLSVTLDRRGRRSIELVGGVILGILVADLVIVAFGSGPLRVGLVALLAASAAVAFGGTPLLVNQAAIAALVVAILQPASPVASTTRLVDALIGCGVALAVNTLLPHDPETVTERAGRPLFDSLRQVLEETASALADTDLERAEQALRSARKLERDSTAFTQAVSAAEVTARVAPLSRLRASDVQAGRATADRLDLVVGDVAALTRGAANVVRHGPIECSDLVAALQQLSTAVDRILGHLQADEPPDQLRAMALGAARHATDALANTATLATCILVGQVRTTVVDLLVITGLEQPAAVALIEERIGSASTVRFVRDPPPESSD